MPALPFTYPDIVWADDMDPYASETDSDLANLIQDVYHVLIEYPNSNPDDPDRGVGVERFLNGTVDAFRTIGTTIDAQLSRDDRITSSKTTITQLETGGFLVSIDIRVSTTVLPLEFKVTSAGVTGGLAS